MNQITIKQDQRNANKGTKRGKALLDQSLKELGGGRSILLDKDGNIIAGNKTFEGAQEAGLQVRVIKAGREELIAVQREDLDLNDPEGEARRLAYLDNRVSELDLAWNAEQMAEDAAAGLDFDSMGFLEGELRQLLESAGIEQDAFIDAGDQREDGDELARKWGVSTNQMWALGNHRLFCGDATDLKMMDRFIKDKKANLTFTSPPYWVGKSYETQKTEEEIEGFIERSALVMNAVTRWDESRIVINTGSGLTTKLDQKSKRHILLLIDKWTNALHAHGWNLRHVRHWLKEGQLMSKSPRTDVIDQHCEYLATYENNAGAEMQFQDLFCESDVQSLLAFYHSQGKQRGQEWTGASWALRSYWNDIKGTASSHGHEAAFPLELPLRHLMLYTKRGENVLDVFCGSGTTLIACEIMGRVGYGVDLSPQYAAATLERWNKFTGKEPVRYE